MIKKIKSAIGAKEIRKKIGFTLLMVLIFRFGSVIPIPWIKTDLIRQMTQSNSLLGLYDMFSGGAFSNFTIFALGIGPYITASIILQLLMAGFENLKELQKSGEVGKKKIKKYTVILAFFISIMQATGITLGMIKSTLKVDQPIYIVAIISILVLGAMIVTYMAEKITKHGLGNGSSVFIFVGIISRLPIDMIKLYNNVKIGLKSPSDIAIIVGVLIFTIIGITFISESAKKIPVRYAKANAEKFKYLDDSSYIPLKVNQSGVMPIIFASSILALPQTIAMMSNKNISQIITKFFERSTDLGFWRYAFIEVGLIIIFSYFYNTISFNIDDISKNIKNSGGYIEGFRPGEETKNYLNHCLSHLTIVGALFLGLMALIPSIVTHYMAVSISFGGTSLLIIVGVALELKRQLDANLVMKTYTSFFD